MKIIAPNQTTKIAVSTLLDILHEAHQNGPFKDQPLNDKVALGLFVSQPFVRLLVDDDETEINGFITGMITDGHIGGTVAYETTFYVKPEHRKSKWAYKLFEAYEEWGKENGASNLCATHYAGDDRVGSFYRRLGYEPVEITYKKTVD